jgi:hypothetical protein
VTVTPVERRRRRRRRRWPGVVVPLLLVLLVFAFGVALGEALHDNPKPGGTQTLVRTLKPLPLAPVAAQSTTSKP